VAEGIKLSAILFVYFGFRASQSKRNRFSHIEEMLFQLLRNFVAKATYITISMVPKTAGQVMPEHVAKIWAQSHTPRRSNDRFA
jgi:hypothetical protein